MDDDRRRGSGLAERIHDRSFEAFYADEYPHVLRIVYSLSGSWGASEEICQDAFVRAYLRWDQVADMAHPRAWLRRVACNLATSWLRRVGAEFRAVSRLSARRSASADGMPALSSAGFWHQVRRLPRRQAQVVALHYGDDLAVDDIATVLDISPGTVKFHLHAARERLAASYERLEEGDR